MCLRCLSTEIWRMKIEVGGYIRDFGEVNFERAASKESFGMARVELGAEDQGSKKLIQWLVNIEDFQSVKQRRTAEACVCAGVFV